MTRSRIAVVLAAASFAAMATTARAQPSKLRNAEVSVRPVAPGSLAAEIDRASAGARRPVWIGYAQPVVDRNSRMCCFDNWSRRRSGPAEPLCCGGCRLERDGQAPFNFGGDSKNPVALDPDQGLLVLLRASGGRVVKVRVFDENCALDAGGLPFVWLTGVRPAESIQVLGAIARNLDRQHGDEDAAGSALAAIALTRESSADPALEALARGGGSRELREQAAFWLGNARGAKGYEVLRALAKEDPDEDFRHHVTFALSQSKDSRAIPTLIDMAKTDESSEVRGQALFWLAQEAGDRAAGAIRGAIEDDPDEEVKTKAVFALSQMKDGDGVGELIRVARTNRNAEVRRQAIFWLGQSRDPRALKFIEEILTR